MVFVFCMCCFVNHLVECDGFPKHNIHNSYQYVDVSSMVLCLFACFHAHW